MELSLLNIIRIVVALIGILLLVLVNSILMVYFERKIAGFIQRRPGPYEVGPQGILQPVADALKLLCKQFFIPASGDRVLYFMAPVLAVFPVFLLFLAIPFGPWLTGLEVNLGLLLILAFSGMAVLAIITGGWAANNKYGLLGAARSVAQSVAYEIPMLLAILAVAFQHGSLNLTEITAGQGAWPWQWNFITQPLAFFIYVVSVFGETNRAPFDLAEAESELTAGFHTEYSGMGFALYFLAEYSNMLVVSFVCAVLFLGGSNGPIADGFWWTIIKAYALMLFMVWVRWTYPRVRFDQLLNINWKWLLPLGLLNLWATALVMKLV